MSRVPSFPELNLSRRPALFDALIAHAFTDDVIEARFGSRTGWVVIDPAMARVLLRRRDVPKGRSAVSRSAVGGYPARTGTNFHRRRSEVVLALTCTAADPTAMASSLAATIGLTPPLRPEAPAAFTRWMLHDLTGGESAPVDASVLAEGIAAAEAMAEGAQAGSPPLHEPRSARAALARVLTEHVDAAHSPFLDELRERAWSTHEIVEELISLSLAGWESTAAAVTTALTIGLPARPRTTDVDELLRLYPPSWLIVRTMTGDEAWGSAGDLAVVSPWISHRSPAWREPERFDPTRTDGPAPFPFGAGPRRCPADLYARTQIAVAVGAFGGRAAGPGRPALLGHRSATLIPDNSQRTP